MGSCSRWWRNCPVAGEAAPAAGGAVPVAGEAAPAADGPIPSPLAGDPVAVAGRVDPVAGGAVSEAGCMIVLFLKGPMRSNALFTKEYL